MALLGCRPCSVPHRRHAARPVSRPISTIGTRSPLTLRWARSSARSLTASLETVRILCAPMKSRSPPLDFKSRDDDIGRTKSHSKEYQREARRTSIVQFRIVNRLHRQGQGRPLGCPGTKRPLWRPVRQPCPSRQIRAVRERPSSRDDRRAVAQGGARHGREGPAPPSRPLAPTAGQTSPRRARWLSFIPSRTGSRLSIP